MPNTVVGLFRTRSEAEEALGKLKGEGFGPDQVSVSAPAVGRRRHYGLILAAVAGAATGGVAGGLLSMAGSGARALFYEQEVESGRVLVSVAGPRLDKARE